MKGGNNNKTKTKTVEKWLPVVGHESRFEVSNHGKIRRIDGKLMKLTKNRDGYLGVRLSAPRKTYLAHRIVAIAFIPNPDGCPIVNHLDHNRTNNISSNLEWCTALRNTRHSMESGRRNWDYMVGNTLCRIFSEHEVKKMRRLSPAADLDEK